jgi:hypothetical protein
VDEIDQHRPRVKLAIDLNLWHLPQLRRQDSASQSIGKCLARFSPALLSVSVKIAFSLHKPLFEIARATGPPSASTAEPLRGGKENHIVTVRKRIEIGSERAI